ncbi:DNA/RNA non-specific endonuclease [Paenibacillus xerothermodurans]|uniref:Endonuclease n=1 Tax=Paenibacillus xerothermodurans TaxID=1977292 RepID=A0A2W1NEI0_PAEXE|nr:DNA/RNA non-specific endonuclease [Paenibacillus xerothermodurans]PZE21491.1 endonuclease [Paenibacillus xerothermodurans]
MSTIRTDRLQPANEALVEMQQRQALNRYLERTGEREHIAEELKSKNPLEVDTPERAAFRTAILAPRDGLAVERIIGNNDLFPIAYLQAGLNASKAVCRIEVRDRVGRVLGHGTGFLVSPTLLLTNNHVLENADAALYSLAQFNYELDLTLRERPAANFRMEPNRFFITDVGLDFTLVAVEPQSTDGLHLNDFGYLPLLRPSGKALVGEYVSIIQHPAGAPKAITIRENKITDIVDDYIHYSADTKEGSSGSPVFNDEWIVLALHHAGIPDPDQPGEYAANEGIRISSIVQYLIEQQASLTQEQQMMLDGMIQDWRTVEHETAQLTVGEMSKDRYAGLTGYEPGFLGAAHCVPHPAFRSDVEQDLVPLESGGHVLNYNHFSIVMSKTRRLAYYTAVNIDGTQLKNVRRGKDQWYFDPRIEQKFQSGPELYSDNALDRGHLVRRRDPVWGDNAEQANEDTFHFTNCSPQHANFNQKIWLQLEDYLLEHADNHQLKVSVFTGPVFRTDDMVYRGFQIPAEFWKVAVMVKSDGNLSATAYLQTQKNLIQDVEFAYGAYKTYQVPVAQVEALTGIQFGELKQHDPINGLEAVMSRVIENAKDMIL